SVLRPRDPACDWLHTTRVKGVADGLPILNLVCGIAHEKGDAPDDRLLRLPLNSPRRTDGQTVHRRRTPVPRSRDCCRRAGPHPPRPDRPDRWGACWTTVDRRRHWLAARRRTSAIPTERWYAAGGAAR